FLEQATDWATDDGPEASPRLRIRAPARLPDTADATPDLVNQLIDRTVDVVQPDDKKLVSALRHILHHIDITAIAKQNLKQTPLVDILCKNRYYETHHLQRAEDVLPLEKYMPKALRGEHAVEFHKLLRDLIAKLEDKLQTKSAQAQRVPFK